MNTVIVPAAVAVIGLLMYAFCNPPGSNPKLEKVGFALFWIGMFVLVFSLASKTLSFP